MVTIEGTLDGTPFTITIGATEAEDASDDAALLYLVQQRIDHGAPGIGLTPTGPNLAMVRTDPVAVQAAIVQTLDDIRVDGYTVTNVEGVPEQQIADEPGVIH